ncbi:MAG: PAS domain S-box protein, partial [Anaerolineales bacterium]|nr:PAS domain S-box protein [Anaerolineales bacterium]
MPEDISAKNDDSFLDVFKKHDAVMLLIEPGTGQILNANPAAEKFYGYSLAQMQGMNIAQINALSPEQLSAEWERFFNGGKGYLIFPHKLAGGDIRTIEAHVSLVNVCGQTVYYAIIHDVSER